MKLQYSIAVILLLALLGVTVWLLGRTDAPQSVSVSAEEMGYLDQAEGVRYQSIDGEVVTVKYADELARVVGGQYDQVVLRQVPAASGVKYEGEQGLTLWTKGDEVRIETPQALAFLGLEVSEEGVVATPEIVPDTPPAATSTEATVITGITWLWKEAVVAGEVVSATKPTEFSVTFAADGQLAGDTDCNGFGGSYTQENNIVTLGELLSTMMFCEDSQEEVFRGLFISPLTVEAVSAESMTLRNADGDSIEFTRGE
jgi:heat shock protein HslJ